MKKNTSLLLTILFTLLVYRSSANSDSLRNAIEKMPRDTTKVISLLNLAQEMIMQDPNQARQVAKEALSLSEKIEFDYGIMKSNSLIAFCYINFSIYDTARIYMRQSIKKAEELNHLEGLGIAYGNMGNTYYYESLFPNAIEWWLKGLKIHEQKKDTTGMVASLCNVGAVYYDMGNTKEAMVYFKKALALNLASGKLRNRTEILSNIAGIYSKEMKKDLALRYYLQALDVARKINSPELESSSLADLATMYRGKKMLDTALMYAHQSLQISRKIGNQDNIGFALLLIGQCHWDFVDQKNTAWLNKWFGGSEKKCLLTSLAYHDSSLALYRQSGMLNRLKLVYDSKSAVQKSLGDGMGAYESYVKASELKDSLFNMELDRKLAQNTLQYEFDKREALSKAEQEKKVAHERNIRNAVIAGLIFTLIFAVVVLSQRNKINKARKRSEELLLNILPEEVAEELKAKGEAEARLIEEVTVLFTDFKGFTALSEQLTPKELVKDLHECFTAFDNIMQKYGLEKIKTIGDAYMAAGGLPTPNSTHAEDVVKAALEIRDFMEAGKARKIASQQPYFEIRIGVHTGPVVAGIVGVKKFSYDIWGDTVNTASRMESSGETGKVNISQSTYSKIKDQAEFRFEPRGKIAAKGKGEIEMYFAETTH